ncbi:hypothetical protein CQW23_27481 [Capsicum baccatum]|uniref:LRR receptor-like serine/threonine-protein kinase GSO1 n=1 Tax=Capsicum baccatum TaxID=33114 RepID=A0A2G2VDS3_CAPBA|nr:hypothetical protein CQW23_27481 [Capsicum baccatum]
MNSWLECSRPQSEPLLHICCGITWSFPDFVNTRKFQCEGRGSESSSYGHRCIVTDSGFEKLRRLRNLEALDLSGNRFNHSIFEPIRQSSSLKSLNLSRNYIGSGSDRLSGLDKLEILDLSYNYLDLENVFSTLQINTSRMALKRLDIRSNQFQSFLPNEELGALRNMEYLLLDRNILDENFLRSSGVMSSLKVLSVSRCGLNGTLPLQGLCDLKYLEELSLSRNKIIGRLPACLGNLTFLRVIDLTDNQFTGNIASSPLSSLLSLEYLLLAYNNFEIPISFESFANHSKLKFVTAENNSVILQTNSISWIPKFQLEALTLSNCSQIPSFLHYQLHLRLLGLSRCNIGGDFPNWLLQNNFRLGEVYLDGNAFTGSLQLPFLPNLEALDISNIGSIFPKLSGDNNLSGNIPAWLGNSSSLKYLALSRNHLKGHIPPDYCRLEGLWVLDLSENNLAGMIPSCFSAFQYLKHVHLSKNMLQGEFNMFSNSSYLKLLDLRENNFSGSIPKWLGSTFDITILLLKGNRLQGTIPPLLCHARHLRMLDISHNNLSGPIPHCLGNITQQAPITVELPYRIFRYVGFEKFGGDALINIEYSVESFNLDIYARFIAVFTTKYNTYSYEGGILSYMSGVDLSCNQLSCEIPKELGNLTEIHGLNLSHNHLTGEIPSESSNLQNIESLDLSYNNLTGRIPTQLLKLTTLEVFTVAHNNLTGRTPQSSAQFATFSESSYEGNPFLCGLPLNISCTEPREIPIYPPAPNCCEDDASFLAMESFYISFLVAYANVVVAVVVVLWLNPKISIGSLEFIQLLSNTNYQHHLRLLSLSKCNIGGDFPNWLLQNNSKLGQLHLDGNAFTGSLQLPFLPNLKTLDISNNKIRGKLPPNIGSIFPNLFVSIMSNNMLEVSDNINNFENLYLDGNNFSGPIPQKLSTALFLSSLDLSENNLSGNIPAWLGNISSLRSLALSRNHLKGHIPPDYCRLEALDLCENNLPSCFSAFQNLKHVHLRKNKLQREFNIGAIPKWLGSTFDITILLLKGNRLQGTIPPLLYHARYLRMLDISHNNLSGPIPHCLGNITQQQEGSRFSNRYILTDAYVTKVFGGDAVIGIESSIKRSLENMLVDTYAWVGAEFSTKYNTYSYEGRMVDYMCGIDLSCNQLSGEIPKELGNLTHIHALNLSHNHLTGAIPSEFSNLRNIESLDLSYNNLTGSIPTQLLKLKTLAVFTVAHNNLTGRTPQRSAQIATFSESSYEGNPFLCGLPLNISCTKPREIPIYPPAPNFCEDDASFLDMESFYISFLVAYANVVVAVVVVLWVNPYWRNVWFYFVESFMYSCYDYLALKCRPNLLRSL